MRLNAPIDSRCRPSLELCVGPQGTLGLRLAESGVAFLPDPALLASYLPCLASYLKSVRHCKPASPKP